MPLFTPPRHACLWRKHQQYIFGSLFFGVCSPCLPIEGPDSCGVFRASTNCSFTSSLNLPRPLAAHPRPILVISALNSSRTLPIISTQRVQASALKFSRPQSRHAQPAQMGKCTVGTFSSRRSQNSVRTISQGQNAGYAHACVHCAHMHFR